MDIIVRGDSPDNTAWLARKLTAFLRILYDQGGMAVIDMTNEPLVECAWAGGVVRVYTDESLKPPSINEMIKARKSELLDAKKGRMTES